MRNSFFIRISIIHSYEPNDETLFSTSIWLMDLNAECGIFHMTQNKTYFVLWNTTNDVINFWLQIDHVFAILVHLNLSAKFQCRAWMRFMHLRHFNLSKRFSRNSWNFIEVNGFPCHWSNQISTNGCVECQNIIKVYHSSCRSDVRLLACVRVSIMCDKIVIYANL